MSRARDPMKGAVSPSEWLGPGRRSLTVARARALLFPELTNPAEANELRPLRTLPTWKNPDAHALDRAIGELERTSRQLTNRPERGRPAPRLRERHQLAELQIECPWYHARVTVLNAVRFAIRDVGLARVAAEEVAPRLQRRAKSAKDLAEQLRAFVGDRFVADAMVEKPRYGALPDLLALMARGQEAAIIADQLLQASRRLTEIADASDAQRKEIAPKIELAVVWKRSFSAALCELWVTLTGARPSTAEKSQFLTLTAAAVAALGGDMEEDFPLTAQIRAVVERDDDLPTHNRLDRRESSTAASRAALPIYLSPDRDSSIVDLWRRILRQIDDGEVEAG